jgi:hypothetical protein
MVVRPFRIRLVIHYRNTASNKIDKLEGRKRILFDGPVDELWVENMNTVVVG